jgi:hypothetical protein
MKRKLLLESFAITALLATIALSMFTNSAFAWGYDPDYDDDTDGYSWQVSCKVVGYYDMYPENYEENHHWAWRGADEISTFYVEEDPYMYFIFYSSQYFDPYYTPDINAYVPYYDVWPVATYAGSWVGSYFDKSGVFWAEAEAYIPP